MGGKEGEENREGDFGLRPQHSADGGNEEGEEAGGEGAGGRGGVQVLSHWRGEGVRFVSRKGGKREEKGGRRRSAGERFYVFEG